MVCIYIYIYIYIYNLILVSPGTRRGAQKIQFISIFTIILQQVFILNSILSLKHLISGKERSSVKYISSFL